jgi:hypothetical protein
MGKNPSKNKRIACSDSQLCNSKTLSTTILYDVRETLEDKSTVIIPPLLALNGYGKWYVCAQNPRRWQYYVGLNLHDVCLPELR